MGNKTSKLSKESVNELTSTTSFTASQIQQWHRGFQTDYPSGITRKDFTTLYKNYFPFGDATKYSYYIFNHIDTDSNNLIDFHEFMRALDISAAGSFTLFDLDEDGMVSKAEMLAIVDSIYRMIGDDSKFGGDEKTAIERVDKVFGLCDTDCDGYLSKSEYLSGGLADPMVINALNIHAGLVQ